jgi:signal transduction histidine kinase
VNRDLLFHLFYNLINNAIKFNRAHGRIYISDRILIPGYEISIRDTGVGIPEAQIPFIFDRFKKSTDGENSGYGLGLTIVKSICNYHHIALSVESDTDQGTVFKLLFPI